MPNPYWPSVAVTGTSVEFFENVPVALPSPGLRSSNGWAVHFSPAKAIESAVNEALERHLLYLTYLGFGWDGFDYLPAGSFDQVEMASLFGRVSVAGRRAGIAVSKVAHLPGFAMGYCCDKNETIKSSRSWQQAFFESFETALYYKTNPLDGGTWVQTYGYEILQAYQEHYLKEPCPPWNSITGQERDLLSTIEQISSSVLLFNISRQWNLSFPFYAAFAHGGDLIPLFFKQRLAADEVGVISELLLRHGLSPHITEFHPVI